MARKHGFRGTPVRPAKTPSTVGRVFEQRGDPMVSAREGREKYGRNLQTEDPDFDRYFAEKKQAETLEEKRFAKLASDLLKPKQVDKGNAFRRSIAKDNYDPQRAAANIVQKMNAEVRKATIDVPEKASENKNEVKGGFYRFHPYSDAPLPELKPHKKKRRKK